MNFFFRVYYIINFLNLYLVFRKLRVKREWSEGGSGGEI